MNDPSTGLGEDDWDFDLNEFEETRTSVPDTIPPQRVKRKKAKAKKPRGEGESKKRKSSKSKSEKKTVKKPLNRMEEAKAKARVLIFGAVAVVCALIGIGWFYWSATQPVDTVDTSKMTDDGYYVVTTAVSPQNASTRYRQKLPPVGAIPPFTIESVSAVPESTHELPAPEELKILAQAEPLLHRGDAKRYGLPNRQPLTDVDRSTVKKISPEPPETWQAVPTVDAPQEEMEIYFNHGDLASNRWVLTEGDEEIAFFQIVDLVPRAKSFRGRGEKPSSQLQYKAVWHRMSRDETKKLATVDIYPYTQRQIKVDGKLEITRSIALTRDSQRLAVTDAVAFHVVVDVFDPEGKHIVGFVPAGETTQVTLMGWTDNDLLLTLAEGKLTAWTVPDLKAVYEVDGGYRDPLCFGPNREWLAASAGHYVDVLDCETGECLARCGLDREDAVQDIAVSPDGSQIAIVYGENDNATQESTLLFVDTQTGQARKMTRPADRHGGRVQTVQFAGPDHFALWCAYPHKGQVIQFEDGKAVESFEGIRRTDRRIFRQAEGRKYVSTLHEKTELPKAEIAGKTGPRIRVECKIGYPKHDRQAAQNIANSLARKGFWVGDNDYVLRVTGDPTTGKLLGVKDLGAQIRLPAIKVDWTLMDKTGKTVYRNKTTEQFRGNVSQFTVSAGGNSVIKKFRMKPGYQQEMIASIIKTLKVPVIPKESVGLGAKK